MAVHTHQFFIKGKLNLGDSYESFKGEYDFEIDDDNLILELPEAHLTFHYMDANMYEIELLDYFPDFVPDKTRLEHKIMAHFLTIAEAPGIIDVVSKPMDSTLYQKLLSCYEKS